MNAAAPARRRALDRAYSIDDLRRRAAKRLPSPVFDFLDGGAESETTLRNNSLAFNRRKLIPGCLVDVAQVDTRTRILGQEMRWPLFCAPTGASRLFHPDGELAVARAAERHGIYYSLSTASTYSIEAVAAASGGPKMFQLYANRDEGLTRHLVSRAKRAGYKALCVTVDAAFLGKRERDLRHGVATPVKLTVTGALRFARRPRWLWGIRHGLSLNPSLWDAGEETRRMPSSADLNASLDWNDIEVIRKMWDGPFALKGIMSIEDARRAADIGITAIILSNHGGRQLDGAAAPIEILPRIADAIGDRTELILDSGVRRGVHIMKALALGARAVAIGRPYLYGLAAGGEAGVTRALDILHDEFLLAMRLSGCADLASIGRRHISAFD